MIVVVGMAFEARIAAGLGVPIVCGGDGQHLAASLARAMAAGCGGLISFGVAGGLAPHLKPGNCVIGSAILDNGTSLPTDARWAQRLMRILPNTVHGPILGVREPIAHADDKAALHRETGALTVDMEFACGGTRRRTAPRSIRRNAGRGRPGRAHDSTIGARRHAAGWHDRPASCDALAAAPPARLLWPAPDVARCTCGSRDAGAGQRVAWSRSRLAGRVAAYHRACRRSRGAR